MYIQKKRQSAERYKALDGNIYYTIRRCKVDVFMAFPTIYRMGHLNLSKYFIFTQAGLKRKSGRIAFIQFENSQFYWGAKLWNGII